MHPYINLVEMNIQEPIDYYEASQCLSWKAAMKSKIESIHKNKTCELMELLAGKNPITSKWVFQGQENIKCGSGQTKN